MQMRTNAVTWIRSRFVAATRLMWLGLILSVGTVAPATAADKDKEDKPTIEAATYKALKKSQELLGEGKGGEALQELKELYDEVEKGTADEGYTLQTWGYAALQLGDQAGALKKFEQALATGVLPSDVNQDLRFMIAQLHAAEGRFDKALAAAEDWAANQAEMNVDQHLFLANLYAQNKRFKETIVHVKAAIAGSDAPKENWYQLLLSAQFETKDYVGSTETLKALVEMDDRNGSYWEQLASIYMLREKEHEALAVLEVARTHGVLENDNVVKSIVNLALGRGIPHRAAKILEEGIAEGTFPKDEKHVEMLANCLVAAREGDRAMAALELLAEVAGNGEPMMRRARLELAEGDWQAAAKSAGRALELGLKEEGPAWLLRGIALIELEQYENAKDALAKARAFADLREQAVSWINYADEQKRHQRWLEQNS